MQTQPLFAEKELPTVIRRTASLSPCGRFRMELGRAWGDGPYLLYIGNNPSVGDHRKDDPTIRRWMHFTRAWGYDRFIAVNPYPYITSDPAECRRWAAWEKNGPDWEARDRIQQNVEIITRLAKGAAMVVACWGAIAGDDPLIDHIIEEIQSGEAPYPDIYCFGKTSSGAPIHPMARGRHRISDNAQPVIWRAA